MNFDGTRKKRSMEWTGWNKFKDMSSVGECLWLEKNDDILCRDEIPVVLYMKCIFNPQGKNLTKAYSGTEGFLNYTPAS